MAKQIANVDILVDTYNTWILRTNEIIGALGSEVLTANSTLAITGSVASPKNARLYGNLQVSTSIANNAIFDSIQANNTHIIIKPNALLVADGDVGAVGGKYLTSDGTKVYWSVAPGQGTVTSVANGAGLLGGTITTAGTLRVKAGAGIDVDSRGVSVNTQFLSLYTTNASTLQGRPWEAPSKIGSSVANTGDFTTVTATTYKVTNDDNFLMDKDNVRLSGMVDATTPGDGVTNTTGGVRIRARGTGKASLQFTNQLGSAQYGAAIVDSTGKLVWTGSQSIAGNLHISTSNATGGGLILSDDGDIVDLNDGYASMRFSSGVAVYSANKGGTRNISLGNDGTIIAHGNIYANDDKRVLTTLDFTDPSKNNIIDNYGYTTLPNGLLIQWGWVSLREDAGTIITVPISYNGGWWYPLVGTSVAYGNNSQRENFGCAGKYDYWYYDIGTAGPGGSPNSFRIYNTENFTLGGLWMTIGKVA